MGEIHLICGPTGAGKTTYGESLALKAGGLLFSIDDWMDTLYEDDKGDEASYSWYMERINRIEQQMLKQVAPLAKQKVPVILDLGFSRFVHREKFREWGRTNGIGATLHYLNLDPIERWRRVEERNRTQGRAIRLLVTREMFDFVESIFEPPTPDELVSAVIIR